MRSANSFSQSIASRLAVAFLLSAAAFPASAQTANDTTVSTQSTSEISAYDQSKYATAPNRAVGVEGRLRQVYWTTAPDSEKYLADMQMDRESARISRAPGAMRHTKVWMARADVCGLPGDEILMQIRSPLTCGTLGCEMIVLSDAGGSPRVIMRTVGDTIDSPVIDGIVINRGSKNQRAWRYDADGNFSALNLKPRQK